MHCPLCDPLSKKFLQSRSLNLFHSSDMIVCFVVPCVEYLSLFWISEAP